MLLGGAIEVGAGVDPVAVAVLLDEAAAIAESAQGIAEHTDRLARHHAGQLHPLVTNALAQSIRIRGGTDVQGTGHPLAGADAAEIGVLDVQPSGRGLGSIHILGNDWLPLVVEEAHQLVLDVVVIERDRAGHDQ